MTNQLQLVNEWLDVNRKIKSCKRLIHKYPGDASLRVELQEHVKTANNLKFQLDSFKGSTTQSRSKTRCG